MQEANLKVDREKEREWERKWGVEEKDDLQWEFPDKTRFDWMMYGFMCEIDWEEVAHSFHVTEFGLNEIG